MKMIVVCILFFIMMIGEIEGQEKIVTSVVLTKKQSSLQTMLDQMIERKIEKNYQMIKWDRQKINKEAVHRWMFDKEERKELDSPQEIIIPMAFYINREGKMKCYFSMLELSIKPKKKIKKIWNAKGEGKNVKEVFEKLIENGFKKIQDKGLEIKEIENRKKLMILSNEEETIEIPEFMILNYLVEHFAKTEEYDLVLPGKYSRETGEIIKKWSRKGVNVENIANEMGKLAGEKPEQLLSWNIEEISDEHYIANADIWYTQEEKDKRSQYANLYVKIEDILEKCKAIANHIYFKNALEKIEEGQDLPVLIDDQKLSGEEFATILNQGDKEAGFQKELTVLILAMMHESPMSIEVLYEKGREGGREGIFQFLEEKGKGVYASQGIQKLGKWLGQNLSLYEALAKHYNKLSPGMKFLLLREIVINNKGKSQDVWKKIASQLPSEEDKQLLAAMLWEEKEEQSKLDILQGLNPEMINWPLYEKALKVQSLKEAAKEKIARLLEEKTMPLLLHLWKARKGMENELTDILSRLQSMPAAACKHILERYETLADSNKDKAIAMDSNKDKGIAMLKKIKTEQAFKLIYKKLKEDKNHNKEAYKKLKEAFFESEYPDKTKEIQDFAYPRPEDYKAIEEGQSKDLTGPEVCRLWTINEIKENPIDSKALWQEKGAMVYAWYAMEGTSLSKAPEGWADAEWKECWKGEYIDFTHDTWKKKDRDDQAKLSSAYRKWYAEQKGLPEEKTINKNGVDFVLCLVPPGKFSMGSPDGEDSRSSDEKSFKALISKPYYIGKYEVTQQQWQAVMGGNPSGFKNVGEKAPVENVSYDDCNGFLKNMGMNMSLPTEAEWEYACRAGTTTPFNLGKNINQLQVNYDGRYPYMDGSKGVYSQATVPVGSLPNQNPWGMYDMHGNVYEWCTDWKADYPAADVRLGHVLDYVRLDSTGCSGRVCRGGSWGSIAQHCRSASRGGISPGNRYVYLGFRLRTPLTP